MNRQDYTELQGLYNRLERLQQRHQSLVEYLHETELGQEFFEEWNEEYEKSLQQE